MPIVNISLLSHAHDFVPKKVYLQLADDGTIFDILSESQLQENVEVRDYSGQYLLPRQIVEHHQHGANGADWTNLSLIEDVSHQCRHIETILESQYQAGIRQSFATLVSTSYAQIKAILQALYYYKTNSNSQSKLNSMLCGVHFEGPYISTHPGCLGAHDVDIVSSVTFDDPENLLTIIDDFKKSHREINLGFTITIDFALEGSLAFARVAKQMGINIAIGHSNADRKIIKQASEENLFKTITHFGNAMANQSHKITSSDLIVSSHETDNTDTLAPAHSETVAALFDYSEDKYFELIIDQGFQDDGNHLKRPFVQLCIEKLGFDKIILVSDALLTSGMPDGYYQFGTIAVEKNDSCVYVVDSEKKRLKLAGNTNQLDVSIPIMAKYLSELGFTDDEIARAIVLMTTVNPALAVAGGPQYLQERCTINIGDNIADFSVLNPKNNHAYSSAEYLKHELLVKHVFKTTFLPLYYRKKAISECKMFVRQTPQEVGKQAANIMRDEINRAFAERKQIVFIIPTGSTPIPMYAELIKMWQEGDIDFSNVIFFNMDEYVGLDTVNEMSYHYFMMTNFYRELINQPKGIHSKNIFLPDGNSDLATVNKNAKAYHDAIMSHIKSPHSRVVLFGGIGRGPAHIAFNDFTQELVDIPVAQQMDYAMNTGTRVVVLDPKTREANKRFYGDDINAVPLYAVTIGMQEILGCNRIVIMANDPSKQESIKDMLANEPSPSVPASLLKKTSAQLTLLVTRDVNSSFTPSDVSVGVVSVASGGLKLRKQS